MAFLPRAIKGHRIGVLFQVLLLVVFVFLFCYSVLETRWLGIPIISFLVIVLSSANIIRLIEKSNKEFAQFINSIEHDDFSSTTATIVQGEATRDLINAQKMIMAKLRKLKADRSAQYDYLKMVVEHVDTALICFDSDDKIEMINNAAVTLLKKKHLDDLKSIGRINSELESALRSVTTGQHQVIKLVIGNEFLQLMLTSTQFTLLEKNYKLVSLQNIKQILDEQEIDSWQKLIRVLTHEIMNSMTPIVSLSHYLNNMISDDEKLAQLANPNAEERNDMFRSIESIESRSRGLINFVNAYRSLSNLPEPEFSEISIESLFRRLETLLKERITGQQISFQTQSGGPHVTLYADNNQLEQVLINLLYNAMDAVRECPNPAIELRCEKQLSGRIIIRVKDNGCGISEAVMENIFTPFFTTKDEGSGIGLSLSRQLVRLNNGTLSGSSIKGKGSVFTVAF